MAFCVWTFLAHQFATRAFKSNDWKTKDKTTVLQSCTSVVASKITNESWMKIHQIKSKIHRIINYSLQRYTRCMCIFFIWHINEHAWGKGSIEAPCTVSTGLFNRSTWFMMIWRSLYRLREGERGGTVLYHTVIPSWLFVIKSPTFNFNEIIFVCRAGIQAELLYFTVVESVWFGRIYIYDSFW